MNSGEATSWQTLALPMIGDLAAAKRLQEQLLEALGHERSVLLEAAEVDECSTALIQVIEVGAATFARLGRRVALNAPSDVVVQAYEDLGLFPALMSRLEAED